MIPASRNVGAFLTERDDEGLGNDNAGGCTVCTRKQGRYLLVVVRGIRMLRLCDECRRGFREHLNKRVDDPGPYRAPDPTVGETDVVTSLAHAIDIFVHASIRFQSGDRSDSSEVEHARTKLSKALGKLLPSE